MYVHNRTVVCWYKDGETELVSTIFRNLIKKFRYVHRLKIKAENNCLFKGKFSYPVLIFKS